MTKTSVKSNDNDNNNNNDDDNVDVDGYVDDNTQDNDNDYKQNDNNNDIDMKSSCKHFGNHILMHEIYSWFSAWNLKFEFYFKIFTGKLEQLGIF